jgi:hypothetical protein
VVGFPKQAASGDAMRRREFSVWLVSAATWNVI